MPGTWIYLSSSIPSEVQLLGFLITFDQSVLEEARSRGLFQDKGSEDSVHWNFCLSISFLFSLTVAGISRTSPFSLSHVSEAVRRIYLMSVLIRKRNPVGALAFLEESFSALGELLWHLPYIQRNQYLSEAPLLRASSLCSASLPSRQQVLH